MVYFSKEEKCKCKCKCKKQKWKWVFYLSKKRKWVCLFAWCWCWGPSPLWQSAFSMLSFSINPLTSPSPAFTITHFCHSFWSLFLSIHLMIVSIKKKNDRMIVSIFASPTSSMFYYHCLFIYHPVLPPLWSINRLKARARGRITSRRRWE